MDDLLRQQCKELKIYQGVKYSEIAGYLEIKKNSFVCQKNVSANILPREHLQNRWKIRLSRHWNYIESENAVKKGKCYTWGVVSLCGSQGNQCFPLPTPYPFRLPADTS